MQKQIQLKTQHKYGEHLLHVNDRAVLVPKYNTAGRVNNKPNFNQKNIIKAKNKNKKIRAKDKKTGTKMTYAFVLLTVFILYLPIRSRTIALGSVIV